VSDIDVKPKTHQPKVLTKIWKSRRVGEERNGASSTSNIELSKQPEMGFETRPGKWISLLASKEKLPTMSGLATLEDSLKAIAVDPTLLYPYSRKDVQLLLGALFFSSAVFSISTGVLLWIIPAFGAGWGFITIVPLMVNAVKYGIFIVDTIAEMRKLRKGVQIPPAKGTRAPPPSIIGGPVEHTRTEELFSPIQRSESPIPIFDPRDVADDNRIVQALQPPRQTTGFEAHTADDTERRPARQDTESSIGVDLYNA
jgi:hypothetical protein